MALFLNEQEVAQLLPMGECIDVLDRAGASGAHGGADVTRVQEVLRYNDG